MLLKLEAISLAFGARPLLDRVTMQVGERERVCIIGRNGEGKSTLLRVAAGSTSPDDGRRWVRPGIGLSMLVQDLDVAAAQTVGEIVFAGAAAARSNDIEIPAHRTQALLSKLQLDPAWAFKSLSGGWRRRVLLAHALALEPQILLLDEPTNHLDIAAIEWLESMMLDFKGALLFVSHDRTFVDRLATRIVELDRGRLSEWPGNFAEYQRRKALQLINEAKENAEFDRKLSQEEVWIRKGVEARRTRNEGRVRALEKMRQEFRDRRVRSGTAKIELFEAERSGKLLFELQNVSLTRGDQPIVRDLALQVHRGDRVGIVGRNGSGKSSLLKLLLGELAPDSGSVRRGTNLQISYYDQQREQLALQASVFDNVNDGNEYIGEGPNRRHVATWLRDFLFRPEQFRTPVSALSGGERNRLLLARVFARPANVLILDEPTNDLDIETLELLEEKISEFTGTLLLVSHDRKFLDHVVSSLLILDNSAQVQEFGGGWTDWQLWRDARATSASPPIRKIAERRSRETASSAEQSRPKRMSFKEQQEFASLPQQLEALEARKAALDAQVIEPGFYAQPEHAIRETLQTLQQLDEEISRAWDRWAALDALASACGVPARN